MEYLTKSASETQEVGKRIGSDLKSGEVLALEGELGAGKTTFVQGLAEGLGVKGRIISPTFIIMRSYEFGEGRIFYHVDLYRLEGNLQEAVENLGLKEVWEEPGNVVVIEWAEKIKEFLPEQTKWIKFEYSGEQERRISVERI